MSNQHNEKRCDFIKIVYVKETINGKTELVPLELYADGSLKRSE